MELGGNPEYLAGGAGKYLTKKFTIHAGLARPWVDLLSKDGKTQFYIGFGYEFRLGFIGDWFKKLFKR